MKKGVCGELLILGNQQFATHRIERLRSDRETASALAEIVERLNPFASDDLKVAFSTEAP